MKTLDEIREAILNRVYDTLQRNEVHIAEDGELRLHLETPTLQKNDDADTPDRPKGHWESDDGLTIPRGGTPARRKWDRKFHSALTGAFGVDSKAKPRSIPVDSMLQRNPPYNGDRLELYQNMLEGGDQVPPIVVEKLPSGSYWVKDGNHRMNAAKLAGVTHLPGYVVNE